MAIYTVQDAQTGKKVKFEWNGQTDPTEHDMARVFAEARGVPQKRVGEVAEQFESRQDPTAVSTGVGDLGGKSYGRYQLASRGPQTLQDFLSRSGYRNQFRAAPGTPSFDSEWKQVAGDPQFEQAQYDYVYENNYLPVANNLLQNHGIDIAVSRPLQELVFSTANQYGPGGGYRVIREALERLPSTDVTEKDLVDAITEWKISNTSRNFRSSDPGVAYAQKVRFERERQAYYDMLRQAAPKEPEAAPEAPPSPDPTLEQIEAVAAQEEQQPTPSIDASKYLPEVEPTAAETTGVEILQPAQPNPEPVEQPKEKKPGVMGTIRQAFSFAPEQREKMMAQGERAYQRYERLLSEEGLSDEQKARRAANMEAVYEKRKNPETNLSDLEAMRYYQGEKQISPVRTAVDVGATVASAMVGGGLVGKGLQKFPALAKSPIVRAALTRAITSGGISGSRGAMDVAQGKKEFGEAFADALQAAGGGVVSMVPEIAAPANAWQLIAQPAADLIYDAVVDAGRGKDVKSKEWLKQELLNLAMSAGFAVKDVASGAQFKAEQAAQRDELSGWLKGKGEQGFELQRVTPEQATDASDPRLFAPGAEDRVSAMIEGTNRMGLARDASKAPPREPVVAVEPEEGEIVRQTPELRKPTVEEQIAKMTGRPNYEDVPPDMREQLRGPAQKLIDEMEEPKPAPEGMQAFVRPRPKTEQIKAIEGEPTKPLTETPESGRLEGKEPADEQTQPQPGDAGVLSPEGKADTGRPRSQEPEGGYPEDWDDIQIAESADAADAEVRGFFDETDLDPWNTPEAQPTAERPHSVLDYDPSVEESIKLEAEIFRHKQYHIVKKKIRDLYEKRGLPPGSKQLKEAVDREMAIIRGEAGRGRFGEKQTTDLEVDNMLLRIAEGLNGEEGTSALAPVARELDVSPGEIHPDDVRAWLTDATISPIDVSRLRGQIKASQAERTEGLIQEGTEAEAKFSDQTADLFGRTEGQQRVAQEQTRLAEERKAKQRANPLEGTMFDAEEMEARATEQGNLFSGGGELEASGAPKAGKPANQTTFPKSKASKEFESVDDAVQSVIKSVDESVAQQKQAAERGSVAVRRALPQQEVARLKEQSAIPDGVNKEANRRMMAARGKPREKVLERVARLAERVKRSVTRQYVELDPDKDAVAVERFRQYQDSPRKTELVTTGILRGVITPMEGDEVVLFERNIQLADMLRAAENQPELFENRPELWFGYKNADEIRADLQKYREAAASNPRVSEALAKRAGLQRAITKKLVEKKLLPKQVLENAEDYYHRQIIEYMDAKHDLGITGISRPGRGGKKSYQKKRVAGAARDFNTMYAEAEGEYLRDAMQQLEDIKMVEDIDAEYGVGKKVDEDYTAALEKEYQRLGGDLDELKGEAEEKRVPPPAYKYFVRNKIRDLDENALTKAGLGNHNKFIPEGYEEIPIGEMRVYRARAIPEAMIDEVLGGEVNLSAEMLQDVMVLGGNGKTIIVPSNIAQTMRTLVKPASDNPIAKASRKAMAAWKWSKLYAPTRAAKYMLNNWFGDADATFAAYPGIFKEYGGAVRDLWKIHQGEGVPQEVLDLVGKGVIGSGYAAQEIPDLSTREFFASMLGKKNVIDKLLKNPARQYVNFVHNLNDLREDSMRLAAYRWVRGQMKQGKDLLGASRPGAVKTLKESKTMSVEDRAAKVSREILGDYGAITETGDFMRKHVAPFWSWVELNTKRYYRLFTNAPVEGNQTGAARAAGVAAVKGAAKIGKRAAAAAAFMMAVEAWNRLYANRVYPGVYDEMDEETRQMRVILHRDKDGNIYSLRAQGAFSDVLGWVGLENASNDVESLIKGEKDFQELGKNAANEFVNKAIGTIGPQYKFLAEVATGKQLYPDLFKPRNIRNRMEYVAKQVEADAVYRWFAKIPSKGLGDEVMRAVIYKQSAGESAYFQTFRIVDAFKEKIGKQAFQGYTPSKKSNALYYYKKAVRYGDERAKKKWLKEYVALAKQQNPNLKNRDIVENIHNSIQSAAPLASLPRRYHKAFERSLSKEDRKVVARAMKWYQSIYSAGQSGGSITK